jgi:IS5 family transposase
MLPELLHGEERKVWGDGGYQGQSEAIKEAAPKAQDMTCKRTKFKNYVDELQKRRTAVSRVYGPRSNTRRKRLAALGA